MIFAISSVFSLGYYGSYSYGPYYSGYYSGGGGGGYHGYGSSYAGYGDHAYGGSLYDLYSSKLYGVGYGLRQTLGWFYQKYCIFFCS